MISVIITAYQEPDTLGRAIEALLPQLPDEAELLVVCHDPSTTAVAQRYAQQHTAVRHVPEPQKLGKPHALNLALAAAQGEIVVLTDGDVFVQEGSLAALLAPFAQPTVGASTGRPVSLTSRQSKLGYWSHLLVEGAHAARLKRQQQGEFLLCSGYYFAARKRLIPNPIPEDALAEDAVISHQIAEQGYQIAYVPEAEVYVKYPTHYADWLRQKVRSAGGYAQDYVRKSAYQMRSASQEARHGSWHALTFAQNGRELFWTLQLFMARLHLWFLVWWQVRWRQRPLAELWQPVQSTK